MATRPIRLTRLVLITAAMVAVSGGLTPRAVAQRVITFGSVSGWTVGGVSNTSTGTGTDALGPTLALSPGGSQSALVLRASPFAYENRDPVLDQSRSFSTAVSTITFQLARDGDIVAPLIGDGKLQISGHSVPGANHGELNATARIELWKETAVGSGTFAATGLAKQFHQILTGPEGDGGWKIRDVHFTDVARFESQLSDGRRYQLQFSFNIGVQVNLGGPSEIGSIAWADFGGSSTYGIAASLSAEPHGYDGNSRTAVLAPVARSRYAVNGMHAIVGVLEPGRAYAGHDSLPADRLTLLSNGAGPANSDEHTLAVASIIAGNGPGDGTSGIAPYAKVISASITDYGSTLAGAAAIQASAGAGKPVVINFSAYDIRVTPPALDVYISANPRTTWVSAAGNYALGSAPAGSFGTVPIPNYALDIISVGALESGFNRPTDFSSTSAGGLPSVPHIMAPGEYVNSAASRDIDNNGHLDDYTRSFLGDDWKYAGGATTNRIAGTSFAAPHVAGAVALLHDLADYAGFDENATDHRVMKAVILAAASTTELTDRAGAAWKQAKTGDGTRASPLVVTGSLNPNLGAGKLDVYQSLAIYNEEEARREDDNGLHNRTVNLTGFPYGLIGAGGSRKGFWDFDTVKAQTGAADAGRGTVDYLLGGTSSFLEILPAQGSLRACLTWDAAINAAGTAYTTLPNLELRLYCDGADAENLPGFDPANPAADYLLASTSGLTENVKLLDLILNPVSFTFGEGSPANPHPFFYLEVANLSGSDVTFGLAAWLTPATIPTPGGAVGLGLLGVLLGRRRRR